MENAHMFRWHPAAVLQGPDGPEVTHPGTFVPQIADRPGVAALAAALAGGGRAFRIGGSGALEAGFGTFEALTGGSLGAARRILRSQASWCASFAVNARLFGIGPGVAVAVLGRLSHSLALYGAVEGLTLGARVHVLDGMRADRQARALAARGVAVLYTTPTQLHGIVAAGVALPDLRHVLVGGLRWTVACAWHCGKWHLWRRCRCFTARQRRVSSRWGVRARGRKRWAMPIRGLRCGFWMRRGLRLWKARSG